MITLIAISKVTNRTFDPKWREKKTFNEGL